MGVTRHPDPDFTLAASGEVRRPQMRRFGYFNRGNRNVILGGALIGAICAGGACADVVYDFETGPTGFVLIPGGTPIPIGSGFTAADLGSEGLAPTAIAGSLFSADTDLSGTDALMPQPSGTGSMGNGGQISFNFAGSTVGLVNNVSFSAANLASSKVQVTVNGTSVLDFPSVGGAQQTNVSFSANTANVTSINTMTIDFLSPASNHSLTTPFALDNFDFVTTPPANTSLISIAPTLSTIYTGYAGNPATVATGNPYNYVVLKNSPSNDSLNVQYVSGSGTASYTLTNLSGAPMQMYNPFAGNAVAASFSASISGGTTSVPISYSTSTAGEVSGEFFLQNNSNSSAPMTLLYNVFIADAPDLVANNQTPLNVSDVPVGQGSAQITVDDPIGSSAYRADAVIANNLQTGNQFEPATITGPFVVDPRSTLYSGEVISADPSTTNGIDAGVDLNSTGLLNGTYTGTLTLNFGANVSYQSPTNPYSDSITWNLVGIVTGHTGNGTAPIVANQSYKGISSTSTSGQATTATLLDGSATNGATTVSLTFDNAQTVSGFQGVGDEVNLSGTAGTEFVLELDFTAADALLANLSPNQPLTLQWFSPANGWENAVLGNTGGTIADFNETYLDFLNGLPGQTLTAAQLGSEGYFYNADGSGGVWAVLNHNSEFITGTSASVPEPAAAGLLVLAPVVAMLRRRRRGA